MMRRRGTTLIEVLITCAVFSLLMIAMFAIIKLGNNAYRDVNSRSDVDTAMNRFQADISTELHRAMLHTVCQGVNIYTPANDFHWAIWFQTPMNDSTLVNINTGLPNAYTNSLGDPVSMIGDGAGHPKEQRWVLYYITRMDAAEHTAQFGTPCGSYASTGGPDTTCPHKWIVKKDIRLYSPTASPSATPQELQFSSFSRPPVAYNALTPDIGSFMTDLNASGSLEADGTATETGLGQEVNNSNYCGGMVARANIVMKNVVSFEWTRLAVNGETTPVASANGSEILFDVKAFKLLDAQKNVNFGQTAIVTMPTPGSTGTPMAVATRSMLAGPAQASINATVNAQYAPYTVQVDNRIIPENP